MTLNLTDSQLQAVVAGAVMTAISPEQREKLLTDAIASLMVVRDNGYSSNKKSPIQEAFEQAVWTVARDTIKQSLTADERVKTLVKIVIDKAITIALESRQEDTVNAMANGLAKFMSLDRQG